METTINVKAKCPICGKDLKVIKYTKDDYDRGDHGCTIFVISDEPDTDDCEDTDAMDNRDIEFEIQKCPDCSNKLSLLEDRIKELENRLDTDLRYYSE